MREGETWREERDDMWGPYVSGWRCWLHTGSGRVRCLVEAESRAGPIWSPEAFSIFLYFFFIFLFLISICFI
jgi:hypothetical protein